MTSLSEQILRVVGETPGMTDREITDQLRGHKAPQQSINQTARALEVQGLLQRRKRPEDGLIGNYPSSFDVPKLSKMPNQTSESSVEALSEDEIKLVLNDWLQSAGWTTQVAWGKRPGIDIAANRGQQRWIIEVKGPGSRSAMRVNYFIGILGETLQRMDDPRAQYSIALPDLKQYRKLWERLPELAKSRTTISLLLVSQEGSIEMMK